MQRLPGSRLSWSEVGCLKLPLPLRGRGIEARSWRSRADLQWLGNCSLNFLSHWGKWGHVSGDSWRKRSGVMAVAPSVFKYFLCGLVMTSQISSKLQSAWEGIEGVRQCCVVSSVHSGPILVCTWASAGKLWFWILWRWHWASISTLPE